MFLLTLALLISVAFNALGAVIPLPPDTIKKDTINLKNPDLSFKKSTTDGDTTKLKEIVVEGQTVKHKGNQDEYVVTKQMREGTIDAGDLIGRIPGIYYNRVTKELKYQGSGNVKILVDSLERDESYIKRLGSKRFDKIYVINNPVGQYSDYDVVISLHTRHLYEGYEGYLSGDAAMRPGSRNGHGKEMEKVNGTGDFTYTREKWNFAVSGSYDWNRTNSLEMISEDYTHNDYKTKDLPVDNNTPNQGRLYGDGNLRMASDYSFNRDHVLSLSVNSTLYYSKRITDHLLLEESGAMSREIRRKNWNNYKNNLSFSEILQYQGTFGAWRTMLSFGLTQVSYQKVYGVWRSEGYSLSDNRDVSINYGVINANASRSFANNKFMISIYEYVIWSNFKDKRTGNLQLLSESHDVRNSFGVSLSYFPSNKVSAGVNVGSGLIKSSASGIKSTKISPTLGSWVAWYPSRKFVARINYFLSSDPASLAIAQDYGQFTDSLEWQGTNPKLKPVTNHSLTASITLWNCLSLWSSYARGNNASYDIATLGYGERPDGLTGYYVRYMWENGTSQSWNTSATFYWSFGKQWRINASVGFKEMYAAWEGYSLEKTMFTNDWSVQFVTTDQSWEFYLSGSLAPTLYIGPQIKSYENTDNYAVTVIKNLFSGRLRIIGMWNIPLHFANGQQRWLFNSEPLIKRIDSNNQFRNNNRIRISAEFRFNGGERVRKPNVSTMNIQL